MAKDITALIRAEEASISVSEKRLKKLRAIAKQLAELSGTSAKTSVSKRGRKKGAVKKGTRGAPRGKRTGPTLAQKIQEVVSGGGSLTSGDIVREVIAVREGTKPPSVYTTLNKLKKDGRLYQEGGFWYSNP